MSKWGRNFKIWDRLENHQKCYSRLMIKYRELDRGIGPRILHYNMYSRFYDRWNGSLTIFRSERRSFRLILLADFNWWSFTPGTNRPRDWEKTLMIFKVAGSSRLTNDSTIRTIGEIESKVNGRDNAARRVGEIRMCAVMMINDVIIKFHKVWRRINKNVSRRGAFDGGGRGRETRARDGVYAPHKERDRRLT